MDYSKNAPDNQNENLVSPSPPPSSYLTRDPSSYLTRDQEHEIMVYALRQVICITRGDTPTSNMISENALPPLDAGPCPLCGVIGCDGCTFQRRHKEIKKEKKHKGVRKKPSGKWSAEIWDPNLRVKRWLGTCPTMEMEAHAYDDATVELVGRISARGGTKKRRMN